jgi:anaerobic ribonucleoside-triphosphate reductase activating protein
MQLNLAAVQLGTRALGPGRRAVVWVQGCPFRCAGCVAPDWIAREQAHLVSVAELARRILADPGIEGLTFSGGEPMLQAAALAELAGAVRSERDVSVICFTGYTLRRLRDDPPGRPGVADLLAATDLLIDGRYVAARDDGVGLRGSSNQRLHHLTGRLAGHADLGTAPRRVEVYVAGDQALMVGVPAHGMLEAFHRAFPGPAGSSTYAAQDVVLEGPGPAEPVLDESAHRRAAGAGAR